MQIAQPQPELKPPVSMENLRVLLVKALDSGRIHITKHFRSRCNERGFTTIDAERIIRKGGFVGAPTYSTEFKSWCCQLSGVSCRRHLEMRVGLMFELDLDAPVVVLITGIFKGRKSACITKVPKVLRL
jgi:hypothetical protein